uniref:Zgc:154075 n=1 Tax=Hippocampus comes TaxID=109280 RepID=A0A3Q2YL17_HIPCM
MSPLVRVIVVGAGCRGEIYSRYSIIHPDRVKVVGVADPRKFARTKFQQLYNIAEENLYEDWRILAEREKCADAVLICTPDVLHKEPAVAFAKKGYHVLLEKPMAVSDSMASKKITCHVYDKWMSAIASNCPFLSRITKLNLSLICFNLNYSSNNNVLKLIDKNPQKTQSSGVENGRIIIKIYLDRVKQGRVGWPLAALCPDTLPDIETVSEALRTGPYGRCVYECDNDVCSNQIVNMEFEGGLTAAFSMVAFTEDICKRKTTIYGSKGELSFKNDEIRVFDFLTQKATNYVVSVDCPKNFDLSGHRRADYCLIDSFISAVAVSLL